MLQGQTFFENGAGAGFLHITTTPDGFLIQFDLVDLPQDPVFNKIPEERFAKTHRELNKVLREYKQLFVDMNPDVMALKPKYKGMYR